MESKLLKHLQDSVKLQLVAHPELLPQAAKTMAPASTQMTATDRPQ